MSAPNEQQRVDVEVVSVLESGATPGPWSVKRHAAPCADNGDIGIVNGNGTLVAVAYACRATESNASLIAAAPELFSALQAAEVVFREHGLRCSGEYKQISAALANAGAAK